eukprot:5363805-Pyramimonas_sp.AAC.1
MWCKKLAGCTHGSGEGKSTSHPGSARGAQQANTPNTPLNCVQYCLHAWTPHKAIFHSGCAS